MQAKIKIIAGILFVLISSAASAQYTKLQVFTGPNGFEPWGSLITDGAFLYGMTSEGGDNNMGTVFKIGKDGTGFEKLFDFDGTASGAFPYGSLLSDGTFLYGMTSSGGTTNNGTIFKIMPDGTGFVKLFDFSGTTTGKNPYGSLITDGTYLYGMTLTGGTSNLGTIFKILKDGSGYVKLFDFTGTANGAEPYGDLLLVGTTLYGTTYNGGSANKGIIFRIQTDGTSFTRMLNFSGYPALGEKPMGSLITDGTFLYGTTSVGGSSTDGTIFKIKNDGTSFTTIKNFRLEQGDRPFASLVFVGSDLYGMTYFGGEGGTHDYGTLFKIKPDGSGHVKLFDFTTNDNGWLPNGSLISDGSFLYGMTQQGGDVSGGGVVFSYELPKAPIISGFEATSGPTGTTVIISGENFSTNPANNFVHFNGWPATVTGSTEFSITTTVPPAATTGPISVNVLGNSVTSVDNFTVISGGIAIHSLDWADPLVGSLDTFVEGLSTDGSGNIYTAGTFTETTDFDPGPGVFELTSAGNFDGYVSKVDSQGQFEWAFRFGDTGTDNAAAVMADPAGNIYVAGIFFGAGVDFDPGPGVTTLPGPGVARFICKYDTDGDLLWARQLDTNLSGAMDMALAPNNDLYITAGFTGTIDFDPGASTFNMSSAGGVDIFILKLTSEGDFIWARRIGGTSSDVPNGIALDLAGNVHTVGYFTGTVDFDPEAATANLSAAGTNQDVFILKLSPAGAYIWAGRVGGTNTGDIGQAVDVDLDGNVVVTGTFAGNGDFDPGAGVVTLASEGSQDIFIMKLDASGNFIWAKQVGGGDSDLGYRIITDAARNIYYSGDYGKTVDFDPGPGTYYLTATTDIYINNQAYVSKLDPDGNFIWAWSTKGVPATAEVPLLALDINEDIVMSGYFENGTVDFDPGICVAGLTSGVSVSSFIVKLSTAAVSSCSSSITFTVQPSSTSGCSEPVTFSVVVSGDDNLVYQWQRDDSGYVELADDATYSGVNTATLTISDPDASLNGSVYRVLVHGDNTSDTPSSAATLTIGTTPAAPAATDPPPACSSSVVALTATGGSDGDYRWYNGSTLIPEEVNGTYNATAGVSTTNYSVSIINGTCESAKTPIVLSVTECTDDGAVIVYNAVSPNGDGRNEVFFIENIDGVAARENKVVIFNRWGDVVFEADNYDNTTRVFKGLSKSGAELPSGTYYYRVEFLSGSGSRTGFVALRR